MEKTLDPIGVRFTPSQLDDLQKISLLTDKTVSCLIKKACRKFIADYALDHPDFIPKSIHFGRNEQENTRNT